MFYSENFEQWKTTIEALPLEEVRLPNQPMDDFVAAIEVLSVAGDEDREFGWYLFWKDEEKRERYMVE